jgi:hypothetical protein
MLAPVREFSDTVSTGGGNVKSKDTSHIDLEFLRDVVIMADIVSASE